jgi:apolipoprotein N-acyltransferase
MTQRPGLEEIDIVVWPETALPFPLDKSADALAAIGAVLPSKTVLLLGSVRWTEERNDKGIVLSRKAFNSLMAVNSAGEVFTLFDKIHLVPFGEFLPYQDFLESLGVMQMTGVRGGFTAGAGPRLLTVPGATPALPLICYEIIFPEEVRPLQWSHADTQRPGWMLNITNDAWFGSSAGPYQHFFQARVRAAELGLPLVRVANTGISALIDPWGRVVAEIPLDADDILDISLPDSEPPTFYYRFGSWVDLLAVIVALLGWFACTISTGRPNLAG